MGIEQAARGIKGGRAGEPSGIRSEDLKGWWKEAVQEKNPVRIWWQLLVSPIQRMFEYGVVPEEVTWVTMILIPKWRGDHRGIGLVELVWKVCRAVVTFRLKRSMSLHDMLHGFRAGRSTGTANLEANLVQQLSGISHEPLIQFFLDVCKAYNYRDKGQCMDILL